MKKQAGQVLLITIMLLATALTVVLAVSFRSTTDTQTAKLEEESQKALAGAEAGIEETLRTGAGLADFSGLNVPSGFTGSASVDTTAGSKFLTPLLQQDEQYTLYVSDYPGFANPSSASMTFYFGPPSGTDCNSRTAPALEITAISGAGNTVARKLIEPCSSGKTIGTTDITTTTGGSLQNVSFGYTTTALYTPPANTKVVVIRALFTSTIVGVDTGLGTLKPQGKTITSEARSPTGVTKRVQLFQSLPQIPADFFVTSF